ncbi:MAG: ferrous iron transport protein A [Alphaproteobacteria bacterium]|nr:ferrous iron transport protein A [Alphaproteobacteria bacterium]
MTSSQLIPLDRLPHGRSARISKISKSRTELESSEPDLEELLLGLGFEEGAAVEIRHQGPFGGPLAVRVDGRLIALRPEDAAAVLVEAAPLLSESVLGA